jgi:hypothetical protein
MYKVQLSPIIQFKTRLISHPTRDSLMNKEGNNDHDVSSLIIFNSKFITILPFDAK